MVFYIGPNTLIAHKHLCVKGSAWKTKYLFSNIAEKTGVKLYISYK